MTRTCEFEKYYNQTRYCGCCLYCTKTGQIYLKNLLDITKNEAFFMVEKCWKVNSRLQKSFGNK